MTHPETGGTYDAQPSQVPHLERAGWQVAPGQDEQGEQWPEELQPFGGQDQVAIHHPMTGGQSVVAASAVPYWRERGWLIAEPEAEGPPPGSEDDGLEGLTVVELQDLARERGLPVSGTKAELLQRLRAEQEAGDQPAPTEEGEG
jgi:hypothetical protein